MWTCAWTEKGATHAIDFDTEATALACALWVEGHGGTEVTAFGPWEMTPDASKLALFEARLGRIRATAHIEHLLREAAGTEATG